MSSSNRKIGFIVLSNKLQDAVLTKLPLSWAGPRRFMHWHRPRVRTLEKILVFGLRVSFKFGHQRSRFSAIFLLHLKSLGFQLHIYGNRIRKARFLRPDLWDMLSLPKTLSQNVMAALFSISVLPWGGEER